MEEWLNRRQSFNFHECLLQIHDLHTLRTQHLQQRVKLQVTAAPTRRPKDVPNLMTPTQVLS